MLCPGHAWIVTRYADGTEVHAHPQHGDEDYARAEALGYSCDVGAMTEDHDPFHTLVSEAVRGRPSEALWGVAHDGAADPALASAEEELVMALQRYVNLLDRTATPT